MAVETREHLPQEGDLYKIYQVDGYTFEIRYGYYEENERGRVEPLPIFPDFRKYPMYTSNGYPLASLIHGACEHYRSTKIKQEHHCGDCIHYSDPKGEVAVCRCEARRKATVPPINTNPFQNPICGGNKV